MAVAWSYYHRRRIPGSTLADNFLIVAPNVIVFERLERDFASNKIFYELPLLPPEWRGQWGMKVILRGDSAVPSGSGLAGFFCGECGLYGTRGLTSPVVRHNYASVPANVADDQVPRHKRARRLQQE